jgi:hypothetical protein
MAAMGQQQSLANPSSDAGPYFFQHASSLGAAASVGRADRVVGHSTSTVPQPVLPSLQCNTFSGDGDHSGNSAASTEGAPEDAGAMGIRALGGAKRRRCVVATIEHCCLLACCCHQAVRTLLKCLGKL